MYLQNGGIRYLSGYEYDYSDINGKTSGQLTNFTENNDNLMVNTTKFGGKISKNEALKIDNDIHWREHLKKYSKKRKTKKTKKSNKKKKKTMKTQKKRKHSYHRRLCKCNQLNKNTPPICPYCTRTNMIMKGNNSMMWKNKIINGKKQWVQIHNSFSGGG